MRDVAAPTADLLYTWYGDDFTGSTDVLEQLALRGVPSALFLAPPNATQLARFPVLRALGVAGDARSRSPQWMDVHLPTAFAALRALHAPVNHYKVCSTFDSSPAVGNIGCAIECGLRAFHPRFVPIVVGAPHLRRFVLQGRLFAAAPDGMVHRIDRHPMRQHPVTPMREPELARHLALQTQEPLGAILHEDLASPERAEAALKALLAKGLRIVLFDTVDATSLERIGSLLWKHALTEPLFSASSSGLSTALLHAWTRAGVIEPRAVASRVKPTSPLLVISGSCSLATAKQIEWAYGHGFAGFRIHPSLWLESASTRQREETIAKIAAALNASKDVVVFTAMGDAEEEADGPALGAALGDLANELLRRTPVQRIVFCGGDTSSHAVPQLGLFALTWVASLHPGAPLCKAHRTEPDARPLELILKGGQVGQPDFFAQARGT